LWSIPQLKQRSISYGDDSTEGKAKALSAEGKAKAKAISTEGEAQTISTEGKAKAKTVGQAQTKAGRYALVATVLKFEM